MDPREVDLGRRRLVHDVARRDFNDELELRRLDVKVGPLGYSEGSDGEGTGEGTDGSRTVRKDISVEGEALPERSFKCTAAASDRLEAGRLGRARELSGGGRAREVGLGDGSVVRGDGLDGGLALFRLSSVRVVGRPKRKILQVPVVSPLVRAGKSKDDEIDQ